MSRSLATDLIAQRLAEGTQPLNRRVYDCLRAAILDRSLGPGTRLPATRDLAAALGVSRNTVLHAYGQLASEGYVQSLTGSGTYVQAVLPDTLLASGPAGRPRAASANGALSKRGENIVRQAQASTEQWGPFIPGVPDIEGFPHRQFERIVARVQRQGRGAMLSYSGGGGDPVLREALAKYLGEFRSVACEPEQILVTEGIHQGVDLTVRTLTEAGDTAWMEEPGYWGIRSVAEVNGLKTVPIPVDAEGMTLPRRRGAAPRLIFVTPSHQYPLGSVMSLNRRLELLDFAREHRAWIVEDDYDSEFRFSGKPIPALHSLVPDAPVVYTGTFSKTAYPALRIGYLVLPRHLAPAMITAHSELYRQGHLVTQRALGEFIASGAYAAHIRRMRLVYASRREVLKSLVERTLGLPLHPYDSHAGLHMVVTLPAGTDDVQVAQRAREAGVLVRPLSRYFRGPAPQAGLLLGFGSVPAEAMLEPLMKLARVVREAARGTPRKRRA